MRANKGDWVEIRNTVLDAKDRAPQVPDDTKEVPLELWVKGYITSNAGIGDLVEVKTLTGRHVKGTLETINPSYTHDFGSFVPELGEVRDQVKAILFGGDVNE